MVIDAVAATFCAKLTEACTQENRRAFESWSAANRVDNPDPLGWKDSAKLGGQVPSRTFRYGMPAYRPPRPTLGFVVSRNRSSSFRTPNLWGNDWRLELAGEGLDVAVTFILWACGPDIQSKRRRGGLPIEAASARTRESQ